MKRYELEQKANELRHKYNISDDVHIDGLNHLLNFAELHTLQVGLESDAIADIEELIKGYAE